MLPPIGLSGYVCDCTSLAILIACRPSGPGRSDKRAAQEPLSAVMNYTECQWARRFAEGPAWLDGVESVELWVNGTNHVWGVRPPTPSSGTPPKSGPKP